MTVSFMPLRSSNYTFTVEGNRSSNIPNDRKYVLHFVTQARIKLNVPRQVNNPL